MGPRETDHGESNGGKDPPHLSFGGRSGFKLNLLFWGKRKKEKVIVFRRSGGLLPNPWDKLVKMEMAILGITGGEIRGLSQKSL